MQVVGATTLSEYRKHIEKDAALERRFQPVVVAAPDADAALSILKGLREKYEEFHKLHVTDAALEAAVKLSNRYITDRNLPDKAIDLMDDINFPYPCRKKNASLHRYARKRLRQFRASSMNWRRSCAIRKPYLKWGLPMKKAIMTVR